MNSFIIVKFQKFDFLIDPTFLRSILGPSEHVSKIFFCQITSKKLPLCSWETQRNFSVWRGLTFLIFWPYGFENFGFLKNVCRGAMSSKNSMGLLKGLRLIAWTTKSSIRGNHWVPLGCMALLGSVKASCFPLAKIKSWHQKCLA